MVGPKGKLSVSCLAAVGKQTRLNDHLLKLKNNTQFPVIKVKSSRSRHSFHEYLPDVIIKTMIYNNYRC